MYAYGFFFSLTFCWYYPPPLHPLFFVVVIVAPTNATLFGGSTFEISRWTLKKQNETRFFHDVLEPQRIAPKQFVQLRECFDYKQISSIACVCVFVCFTTFIQYAIKENNSFDWPVCFVCFNWIAIISIVNIIVGNCVTLFLFFLSCS